MEDKNQVTPGKLLLKNQGMRHIPKELNHTHQHTRSHLDKSMRKVSMYRLLLGADDGEAA